MKIVAINVLAVVVFAGGIAGLFVWEASATRADKDFYKEVIKDHKGMY